MSPTLDEQIECVERELKLREGVYQRLVWQRRMSEQVRDRELTRMRAVLETLQRVKRDSDCKVDTRSPEEITHES